jgi:hypothetical protein
MHQLAYVQSRVLAVVKVKVYSRWSGDIKAEGCLRELFIVYLSKLKLNYKKRESKR